MCVLVVAVKGVKDLTSCTHTKVNSSSVCVAQGLLGVFFKIEAVALFEDIEPALSKCEGNGCKGSLNNVEYFDENDVSKAYSNAA